MMGAFASIILDFKVCNELVEEICQGMHPTLFSQIYFSGLSAPDGLIIDLFGPIAGRHHDMRMVRESNINGRIRDVQHDNDQQYVMYADKGYVDMTHLVAAYHGAELTPPQIQINGILALVRVSVEWCFGKITESQKYIDFPRS